MKKLLSICFLGILFSCTKEKLSEPGSESIRSENKNADIIRQLAGSGSNGIFSKGSYTVENVKGILKFNSDIGLTNFFESIDSLENVYDYTNSTMYDDTRFEVYHLGDAMLNAFDSSLAFSSLRSKLEMQEFLDDTLTKARYRNIEDPYLQTVLNEYYELMVGDKYYNFSNPSITIQLTNPSLQDIDKVRFEGFSTDIASKQLFGIEERPLPVLSGDHQILTSFNIKRTDANGVFVKLSSSVYSPEVANYWGPSHYEHQCCGYNFSINWGDGTTSVIHTNNVTNQPFDNCFSILPEHFYSKTGINSGTCNTYNIIVTATKDGTCTNSQMVVQNGQVFQSQALPVSVCNAECKAVTRRQENSLIFAYGGSTYKVRGEIQQNSAPFFGWTVAKFWSRITFYKRKSNGRYKKAKPPVNMTANATGKWYQINCTSPTDFNESRTQGNRREFKVKVKGMPVGFTTSPQDNPPVRGNYNVVVGYSGSQPIVYTLSNVLLW